jgi:hypothetical protein
VKRCSIHLLLGVLACLFVAAPSNAYAYLDPGTGSFIMQGLVAGAAGGLIAIRTYWRRIRRVFRRSGKNPDGSPETPETLRR